MSNQLYYGDNLENLRKYVQDETVDLCYIDPPFNSKRNYNQIYNNVGKEDLAQAQAFIDTWTWDDLANIGLAQIKENYHGKFTHQSIALINGLEQVLGKGSLFAYLVNMTLRIAEIHRVLKATGSFYLHCDPSASHYLKLVLDAIFCPQGGDFRNEIIWRYTGNSIPKNCYARKHDIIFWYSKSKNIQFYPDRILQPYSELTEKRYNHTDKEGKRYKISALKNGKQEIIYRKEGKYCDDVFEIPILRGKEHLGYPTQKPEALLERIIKASSNEGDVILDAFCGCGTTIAVAQRLNRQWIGIDITYQSISLILKRLTDSFGEEILDTIKFEGIPKDVESAQKLALKKDDRLRKEFEKWAVLTYSNNRATISDKKGADKGIDGIAYFQGEEEKQEKIILQVKSGKVQSRDIRDLFGTVAINDASLGVFITLNEPTKEMIKTAKSIGHYQNNYSNPIDKISIVTVKEIIEQQKRLNLKLMIDVLKSAEKQQETKTNQNTLEI